MTIIAGFSFKEGSVMMADSRVTWLQPGKKVFSDTAQKIAPLGKKIGLAYAGNVSIADKIVRQLRQNIRLKNRLSQPRKLAPEVTRIARHHFQKYGKSIKNNKVSLILGGVNSSGNIYLWSYDSPNFEAKKVSSGFVVAGSGAVVARYAKDNYPAIKQKQDSLKSKADALIMGLESELLKHSVDTVGGLFQVILLTPEGIRPMRYGYTNMDPDSRGDAKSITMEKGKWIQHDEAKGKDIHLVEPLKILSSKPAEKRFYEYRKSSKDQKTLLLYLSYFITCLKVERSIGETIFKGVASQIGAEKFPLRCPLVASVAFWGTGIPGIRDMTFRLDTGKEVKTIATKKIDIQYLPDRFEVDTQLTLEISSPGAVFLECLVAGKLLARKALFFDKVIEKRPKTKEEHAALFDKITKNLIERHRRCSDPYLKKKNAVLEYFTLCHNCILEDGNLKFSGEMRSVYWEKYPLPLKIFFATAFRFSKGEHHVRLDLVNIATREVLNISNTTLTSTGECISASVYGTFVVKIPKPALYWVDIYVDDEFTGKALLPVETSDASRSYSLTDDNEKRVKAGELLILLQRSIQKK